MNTVIAPEIQFAGNTYRLSFSDLLPPLSESDYEELKESIQQDGVLVSILVTPDHQVVDGQHRLRIAVELGLRPKDVPMECVFPKTQEQAEKMALSLNLHRRQLTRQQRDELIAKMRARGWSGRKIADMLNVGETTVRACPTARNSAVGQAEKTLGIDGKLRPATAASASEREERDAQAAALQREGVPVRDIADQLGVSRGTAAAAAKRGESSPSLPRQDPPASAQEKREDKMGVHFSSQTAEHYTPRVIIDAVLEAFGGEIDLDPCSHPLTELPEPNVPAARHFTIRDCSLAQDWMGKVYMNPPYGREIGEWVEKLVEEHRSGNATQAIALVPARTDTQWWRDLRDYPVCFIAGRLTFVGSQFPAPFPSAVFYLGSEVDQFHAAFAALGDIWCRREQAGQ